MITIVGATGNIGSVIARKLLASGTRVKAVSRSLDRLAPLIELGAEPAVVESILDENAMATALQGARAVYSMVPPTSTNTSYADAGRVLAQAVSKAKVSYVVNLSALGAHDPRARGHIADYVVLEKALDQVDGLHVLHLRPSFFMTSFNSWINLILSEGQVSGLFRGDLPIPRIASRDIAAVASEALMRLDFRGKSARELHGQRDLSMDEAAKVIGTAIGNSSLRYVQRSSQEWLEALMARRISRTSAQKMVDMYLGWNDGTIRGLEKRSAENTTPTTFETFVAEEFVPRFVEVQQVASMMPS